VVSGFESGFLLIGKGVLRNYPLRARATYPRRRKLGDSVPSGDDYSGVLHKIERRLAVIAICLIVIAASSAIVACIAWAGLSAVQQRLEERRQAELPHAVILPARFAVWHESPGREHAD
jgi:hypothetical protein